MLLERLFPGARRRDSFAAPSRWLVEWFDGEASSSGMRVGMRSALRASPVWRGVNIIAGDVAKVPLHLYRRDGQGKRRAPEHPAYALLRRRANAYMSAFELKRTLTMHALLVGNGYAWIERDRAGRPIALRPLWPRETEPRFDEAGRLVYVARVDQRSFTFAQRDVLHIRNLASDGVVGRGICDVGREAIGLALAAEKYGGAFFGNGARPSTVIETPVKLSEDKAARLREAWERAYRGVENAHRVAVLDGGLSVKTFGISNNDAQFLETRQFQLREVANLIGVPPHKLGDATRTAYASLEQENQSYLQDCLDLWFTLWEDECYQKLLSEEEQAADDHFFEFLRAKLVSMSARDETEILTMEVNNGLRSLNEARAIKNLPSLPPEQGDRFRIPVNIAVIGPDGNPMTGASAAPAPPPSSPDAEAARAAARQCLDDAVARMVRRLGNDARRAAREPLRFIDWLDGAAARHRDAIAAALAPPLGALEGVGPIEAAKRGRAAAERLIRRVSDELLELAGRATPARLAAEVDAAMTVLERCGAALFEADEGGTDDDDA